MSSNSRELRNSLNDLGNDLEFHINHNNDNNGGCFCNRVLNLPLGMMECCYTIGHKKCLINFVSYCERCPSMDCLKEAKKEDVKDFLRENNSTNNILSMLKNLERMVVNFVKNVSLAGRNLSFK
ncbi:unnamed protein product [Meloidogyne enterolobii]|uniref:Uncharacterized protein n=2 Tax=Meloidogyne enterolobii TaxID=390850 RepID=A0ACB0ZF93_MELEN|nr:unnamed protein product [Meloidogyne enterolobii]